MKIAVIGASGMLGQALCHEAASRNFQVYGIARGNADYCFDITRFSGLTGFLEGIKPDVVINAAAETSLVSCEQDPCAAYLVNARSVANIAEVCALTGAYFVQVSTDHYFCGDRYRRHDETASVQLVNEYARSKYAGEAFALTYARSLVVRTNIVGFRRRGQPTFVEWAINALNTGSRMTLFEDFFTSSIHVAAFSKALLDLLPLEPTGILNIAAHDVCSKKIFIEMLADSMGADTGNTVTGSVKKLADARRADTLGLDVGKAEKLLGYELPSSRQVVDALVDEYRRMMP